jgi:fatty-acyl-CoA synthase|tara:strand:+ start:555 stop:2096 length:1542 start_codon:yes stop_codon:yes gene_type:complete
MATKHYDWVTHHAQIRPGKVAIVDLDNGREISYEQLDQRASRLASWFQANGVAKGDRVAVLLPNCPEFFEIQFACSKSGSICLPLNWRLTARELEYILEDSTSTLLIYDTSFREVVSSLADTGVVGDTLEVDAGNQTSPYEAAIADTQELQPVSCTHDDISMIMYTSGTTGQPKGALITHGMTFFNCVNLGIPVGINSNTVQLVALPLFHTGGLNCYANPVLHAGGRILLMRDFDPGRALNVLGDPAFGVTHFFAVPAPYQFMMQHPDFETTDLSRLQAAGVGGAPCAEAILLAWIGRGVSLIQGWGMTETSPGAVALDADDALRKIGSSGKALLHTEIKIVDDKGVEVQSGDVGELLIKGPNITPGYWNNPEATMSSFRDGWLMTGDAARCDEEGFVYIVDRWKDMYISGGENVYPAEVENILYQLPQIAEAAIIGIPSERWGETGKAILVLKEGETPDEGAVIAHCLENLAKFKVPQDVVFIDALPRNATGKVLKRELRARFVEDNTVPGT